MRLLLFFIIFLAFSLRFFDLGGTPLSLNRDEVGLGYDAYSLLHTGRDQFGKLLPLTLRSSDDYKPALYVYSTIPPLLLFGLNAFAVRLSSAFMGVLTIIITYYLLKTILDGRKYSIRISLISAFLLAVSPWHVQFSRGAFEANLSLFWMVAGLLFFFKSRTSILFSLFAGISLGCSLLTYHAARFVVPVLIFFLFMFNYDLKKFRNKYSVTFLSIFLVLFILIFPAIISREAQIRFRVLNIFSDPVYTQQSASKMLMDENLGHGESGRFFHNRRLIPFNYESLMNVLTNFRKHIDPSSAVFGRDDARIQSHHAPEVGVVSMVESIFILLGFVYLLKNLDRKSILIPLWFFVGFIPAVITWDVPSYLRGILVLPTIQFIASFGVVIFLSFTEKISKFFKLFCIGLIIILTIFNIGLFCHQYFVHLNYEEAESWRYGRKESALLSEQLKGAYEKVIVSTSLDDPHLFYLFYLRYNPETYLSHGGTVRGGWTATENRFDKYEFHPLPPKEKFIEDSQKNVLYVGFPQEFPEDIKPIKTINYPNGSKAIVLVAR